MDKILVDFIAIEGNKVILEAYVKAQREEALEDKKGSFSEQLEAVGKAGYTKGFKEGSRSKGKDKPKDGPEQPECFNNYPKTVKDITTKGCRKCSFHKKCKGK